MFKNVELSTTHRTKIGASSAKRDVYSIKPRFISAARRSAISTNTWHQRSFRANFSFLPRVPLSSASQRHSKRPLVSGSLAASAASKIVTVQSGPNRFRLCRCPDAERSEVVRVRGWARVSGLVSHQLIPFTSLQRCQSWRGVTSGTRVSPPRRRTVDPGASEPPSLDFLSVFLLRRDAVNGCLLP